MNQPVKLIEQEITEIQQLQEKFQRQIYKFGNLTIRKLKAEKARKQLEEQEISLNTELEGLEVEENKLIDKFLTKYGEGQLDLASGTFIPEKGKIQTTNV